jgi:hypothetical protein
MIVTKIVYNGCYGGFGLSDKAVARYWELKGLPVHDAFTRFDIEEDRADPILVQVVEELGEEADAVFSDLQIREIPEGTLYRIDEYDGRETVMTQDEYTWKVA